MEQFLKKLGINKHGFYSKDQSYVIDIENSDEYGRFYTILDKSSELDELEDNNLLTVHSASVSYANEKFQLTLLGDFDEDLYKQRLLKTKQITRGFIYNKSNNYVPRTFITAHLAYWDTPKRFAKAIVKAFNEGYPNFYGIK